MNAFLSHAHQDKDIVEAIGTWLNKRGVEPWIDTWRMTPGDSLIEKIGDAIQRSDRLVVFLSQASADSNWVRKEVGTGLVMELAEDKGLGEKFVIPALLTPCKVPILLRDKLYADFTNKAFDAACEELYRGILDTPAGLQDKTFENRIVRFYAVDAGSPGKYAIVVEFGVRISPTEGLHVGINTGSNYTDVQEWFGPPNQPTIPAGLGGVQFFNTIERREPPIYARKFSSPGITSTRSFYWRFESDSPFDPKDVHFLDAYDRVP
ncbi:MAG: toll/interleukin-1 receptor domain-containing protein [Dehalococcoidia bacterium]|nr:toll/interleukin-1 receptor domain-containing protein [Dehalococcoidia bacterium]